MTITIKKTAAPVFALKVHDTVPGRAYEAEGGTVYIGVAFEIRGQRVVGVSVSGEFHITLGCTMNFREVDLEVIVKN